MKAIRTKTPPKSEDLTWSLPFCTNLYDILTSELAERLSSSLTTKSLLIGQEALKKTIAWLFDKPSSWYTLWEVDRAVLSSILKENKSLIEEKLTKLVKQKNASVSATYLKTSAHQKGMVKITETDHDWLAVSIDPLIEAVSPIWSPDTDPTRKSNRDRLSKKLTWDGLENLAKDRNWNWVPNKTNLQYIIDQCDKFIKNGWVTFDYTHNGVLWCTKFNIPTSGNNVFRPLLDGDLPIPNGWDYFCTTNTVWFITKKPQVYISAMKNNQWEVTDTINNWIDDDGQWNPNYFKKFAQGYQDKWLTLNDKKKYNIFLDDLAKTLNITKEPWEDKSFAKVAYQYIMATMIWRYRWSMRDASSHVALLLWEDDRWWGWDDGGDSDNGVVFAGSA